MTTREADPQDPPKYASLMARARAGKTSPRQAIKAKCLECVGFVRKDVQDCSDRTCPLWTYRPYRENS